jgi:type II secretory pathway predicted ATPase ExeA
MYTEHFGLRLRPFDISPDDRFLYLSDQHDRAIANIRFAIANKDCFVVITGEIGVGKTTILNNVIASIDEDINLARLTHTSLSPVELLQAVLLAFDQPVKETSKVLLFDQVRQYLLQQYEEEKHVIIAVDEAQNLGMAALEELRLLTCIDANNKALLTVVLMGQPGLSQLINSDQLENLRQRTRLRQHLRRLNVTETIQYLKHRLKIAGGAYKNTFTDASVKVIYEYTLGTPRLINTLCDTAMTAAVLRGEDLVTVECVREVIQELEWPEPSADESVEADRTMQSLPTLAVYNNNDLVCEVPITAPLFVIGRDPTNHLQLNDRFVSRRHAMICKVEKFYRIEDLGSVNPISVNKAQSNKPFYVLADGDLIVIGNHKLVFRDAGLSTVMSDSAADGNELPKIDFDTLQAPA